VEVYSGLARRNSQGDLAYASGDPANSVDCIGVCSDSGNFLLGSGLFSVVDNTTADRLRGIVRGT
jgi:hypothetical protein